MNITIKLDSDMEAQVKEWAAYRESDLSETAAWILNSGLIRCRARYNSEHGYSDKTKAAPGRKAKKVRAKKRVKSAKKAVAA